MAKWHVGLSAWIIQDGNYGEFHRNQQAEFALEFYPEDCKLVSPSEKRARPIEGSTYSVAAQVLCATKRYWVIDFGVPAYQQAPPPDGVERGSWIEAQLYLGIDPFFYFEELAGFSDIPPLIHSWSIKSIGIQTARFIEQSDAWGNRVLVRDKDKSAYQDIERTDAWGEDGVNAEYVLDCELVDCPPSRFRST